MDNLKPNNFVKILKYDFFYSKEIFKIFKINYAKMEKQTI